MKLVNNSRHRIAREAATLLYFGAEKEYKQAKLRAAKILASRFLPTNLEVAIELDRIAEEIEGSLKKRRLVKMRLEAMIIMKILEDFHPLLIGSVWRGTIRQESDIDITLFHDIPSEIVDVLRKNNLKITKSQWITVTERGNPLSSLHVYLETSGKQKAEIVIRSLEQKGEKRKCEIFGDELKGLTSQELKKLLEENPAEKFIPC